MDEARIRRILEDPDATAGDVARALCSIDLADLADIVECRRGTWAYFTRMGRRKSAAAVGEKIIEAQARYERGCRYVAQLRAKLQDAEAAEAEAALHAPPPGMAIRGDQLTVRAGDGEGTALVFTLSGDEFRALAAAFERAADRLDGLDVARPTAIERVPMRLSA